MTEYFRQPDNEMRADWAYHVGLLLHQYESFCERLGVELADRFEITLQVSLLQSLLT